MNSNRLQNWDYSSETVYFITLATENRKCIFGSIIGDKMILNDVGQIVENEFLKSIKIRKNRFFHNWIVMPNHIHLLIEIQNNDDNVKPQIGDMHIPPTHIVETHSSAPLQIRDMNENVNQNTKQTLNQSESKLSNKKIGQTNYHDHIVRNYKRFETIYNYIKANPRSWETDSINLKFQ